MTLTSEWAGLSFRFQAVDVMSAVESNRGRSTERSRTTPPPPRSGSGVTARSVAFDLCPRKPGPAYNSPRESRGQQAPDRGRGRPPTSTAAVSEARSTGLGQPSSSSLANLKLASLRRRSLAQAGSMQQPPVAAIPAAAEAAAGCAASAAEAPLNRSPGVSAFASGGSPAAADQRHQAALLQDAEGLLAGCSSRVLHEPAPSMQQPPHVAVGRPVLALPPQLAPRQAAEQAAEQQQQQQQGFCIAAYRPEAGRTSSAAGASLGADSSSSATPHATVAEATGGGEAASVSVSSPAAPAPTSAPCSTHCRQLPTLEDALRRLRLLAAAPHECGSSAAAVVDGSQARWRRLEAVQIVLDSKRTAAASSEVLPLLRRLRQVRLHLVFHEVNVHRARSRSPRRSSHSPPRAASPWLSGRSSAVESKHRSIKAGNPAGQLQARPKPARPSTETSELQVQLLSSLQQKLLLKLSLLVLKQAAAEASTRQQLLAQVQALAGADICQTVLLGWRHVAVPSAQQEAAARQLAQQQAQRRQQAHLHAWRAWASHCAWRHQQLSRGLAALRRRLLAAGVRHWRCHCQQELVRRLHAALADRWLAVWSRRRVFAAWRQAASRSAHLKAALLSPSRSASSNIGEAASARAVGQRIPLPTQLQVLAATAASFGPVKSFVAEAVQQLQQLRCGLRFDMRDSAAAAAACEQLEEGQQRLLHQHQHLPSGSVEALLALMSSPRQQQQQQRLQEEQQRQEPAPSFASACVAEQQAAGSSSAARQGLSSLDFGQEELTAWEWVGSNGADVLSGGPTDPAPDPGSPTGYNPAAYASPGRSSGTQPQQQHGKRRQAGRAAEEPAAAVEAELLRCQEQVAALQQQLAVLEQDSEELQQQCAAWDEQGEAVQQAACDSQQARADADADAAAAAEAMQAAITQHAAAAAECSAQERLVQQWRQEGQRVAGAAAAARAAVLAATELHTLSDIGVQRWSKAVEGIARELTACHRSQQAPVLVRLKEARQQLDRHRQEAAAAQQQLPELREAAVRQDHLDQQAQQATLQTQQGLLAAAERCSRLQLELSAAINLHETAAVAAVAASQAAAAAQQQQRLLASQEHAAAGRLQQLAQQALQKQQEAARLQVQVQQLQQRHRSEMAAAAAAATQQRRPKRRLQVVQEQADPALPSPTAVQQRRPAPAASMVAAVRDNLGGAIPTRPAAAGVAATAVQLAGSGLDHEAVVPSALALRCEQPVVWSCSSSELGSPLSDADVRPLPPLTVDAAAARFYTRLLLRRAVLVLRHEAAASRLALLAATESWQRRQLLAAVAGWRTQARDAAEWLVIASSALRRRSFLRCWRLAALEQSWRRQAKHKADCFARHQLLAVGWKGWQQQAQHEQWRDSAHRDVVLLRLRNMLRGWHAWATQRRQKAARQRAALAVHDRRLLAAALRQWHRLQHGKALLLRVFTTAAELWQEEVGVRLHQRNYERVAAGWRAWQLAVLQAQEERRQAMLCYAADAHRERCLLAAALAAFQTAAAGARARRQTAALQARMLAEWRHLAATSVRHREYEDARRHRRHCLARAALHAWRSTSEATSAQLAHFWLRWRVQMPLRRMLLAWRAAAADRHKHRELCSMAAVHNERRRQQQTLAAFAANVASSHANRASASQGHRHMQPAVEQQWQPAAACHAASLSPQRQQQQQQQQRQQASGRVCGRRAACTTTIVIRRGCEQQQQREPAPTAPPSAAVGAVSDWRAAAEYWRQRHQTYSEAKQQQLQQQQSTGSMPGQQHQVHVHGLTAATLQELRQQV